MVTGRGDRGVWLGRVAGPGQGGVVTRRQLVEAGVTEGQIRARVRSRRWRVLHSGVYATFSDPPSPRAMVWAAVLRAGPDAVAGPLTSLWLAGAVDSPPSPLDVMVPAGRMVRSSVPFRVHRARDLLARVHPVALPPRLRIEYAVLDTVQQLTRAEAVVDLVITCVRRGLTTAPRLRVLLTERKRQRWRGLLVEVLDDVARGVRSGLERRWFRTVERAHGLPCSVINSRDDSGGRREYRDFDIKKYGLVIETDGQETHPVEEAFRDRARDNRVTVSGRRTLRYGWHEIVQDPCGVAGEVAAVLRMLGWTGHPRPCGRDCSLPRQP
ncbi:MAG: hypothetical protein QG622_3477 [Actinomycetota bacterium]|nr:hypothetical protein [Actinomycetota bacterium]